MEKRKLKSYGGNYDAFIRTRLELLENQMKQYQWEQDQIAHMKVSAHMYFILFFGIIMMIVESLMAVYFRKLECNKIHFFAELHCKIWSWFSKTCTSGSVQGKDLGENGCWWTYRKSD